MPKCPKLCNIISFDTNMQQGPSHPVLNYGLFQKLKLMENGKCYHLPI